MPVPHGAIMARRRDKAMMARPPARRGGRIPLAVLWCCAKLAVEPPVNSGRKGNAMAWTTPTLIEICIGLEINGYLPAEF
jgi:coenzyme PQQ precursor peptide PqqA